jgi:hypothetical protein
MYAARRGDRRPRHGRAGRGRRQHRDDNQGSSEVSMMFGIKTYDAQRAVRALYDEFFAAGR